MKILFYGYPETRFGAPHQAMAAVYLARRSHRVDYVCWGGGDSEDWGFDGDAIHYMPQPKKGLWSALRLLAILAGLIIFNKKRYDVIYVQGAQQTPFLFWLPMFKRGRRIVYHTQDYLEPRRHRFYERFERWFTLRADYVICNEVNRARFMKSHYGLPHLPAVIRTALPAWWPVPDRREEMREKILRKASIEDSDDAVIIVAGGSFRGDRMSPQLLEAFSHLPGNYLLVFNGINMAPGEGSRVCCEQKMGELGIDSRVVFLGELEFSELLALYCAGDIGILLYPNDGVGHYYQCPGRFTEYLRGGLSLVSSNFIGLELLTLKYGLGAVCDSENPESIRKAIEDAGRNAKADRDRIIAIAKAVFVYEKEAGVLDQIVDGTYEQPTPSVLT